MRNGSSYLVLHVALLVGLCTSCCPGPRAKAQSYQLHILRYDLDDLGLGYEYEQVWPILLDVDLTESILTITEDDIEVYDWTEQAMTLTRKASARSQEAALEGDYFPNWAGQAFVVTLNGEPQYGGIFEAPTSAAAARFPVIYAESEQDIVVFHLRPAHMYPIQYQDLPPSLRSIIEIPEIHDLFLEEGKLLE